MPHRHVELHEVVVVADCIITPSPEKRRHHILPLTLPNGNLFSRFDHRQTLQ